MKRTVVILLLAAITIVCMVVGLMKNVINHSEKDWSLSDWSVSIGTGNMVKNEEKLEDFSQIDLNMDVSDLDIVVGDEFGITYNCSEKCLPTYEVKDGKLIVEQKKNTISIASSLKCNMTITVPDKESIQDMKVKLSVGDVNLKDLIMKSADIDLNVGDLKINDAVCDSLKIEENTGDTKIKNILFEEIYVDNNVGDVVIGLSKKVEVCGKDLKTDIGSVTVDGSDRGKSFVEEQDSKCAIKVENNVGDIDVSYASENE